MTMTDPIADMLTRIRNASKAKHLDVEMPHSKFKEAIAKIMKEEGYIDSLEVSPARVGKTLKINLKYVDGGRPAFEHLKRVSKPGLRQYAGSDNLPLILGGLGVAIISTSSGLMTDKKARELGVGGELVAYIW